MTRCPKCRQQTDEEQCPSCDLVFADYEQEKMRRTGEVYQLISGGELLQAKKLAEQLSAEFPESRTDFILLISNINRDLNIAEKYQQAKDLFEQGEHEQAALLLRNIKAFDPGLEEKVIALRRKAQQQDKYEEQVKKAADLFEKKWYGEAWFSFLKLHKQNKNDKITNEYLQKLRKIRQELINEVVENLGENNFQLAQEKMSKMQAIFPDAEQEYSAIATLLQQKKEINTTILEAAETARKKGRLLEAKVMYTFLYWQNHDMHPYLRPYLKEIGGDALVSLADCASYNLINCQETGLQVTKEGFLKPVVTEQELADHHLGEGYASISPVDICPEPLADPLGQLVNIDGLEIADFA
jgi:hypothetical protein